MSVWARAADAWAWATTVVLWLGPGPLATLVVAIVGLTFTYRQSQTSEQKLRLDLFEKRFLVYSEVLDAIAITLIDEADSWTIKKIKLFQNRVEQSRFLFNGQTYLHFESIMFEVGTFKSVAQKMRDDNGLGLPQNTEDLRILRECRDRIVKMRENLPKLVQHQMQVDRGATYCAEGLVNARIPKTN
jgi:hypothetical protein